MTTTIIPILTTLQAAFSSYNLYLAQISVRNLMTYEPQAKKAAKWLSKAENDLYTTRTTQASNIFAHAFTLLTSTYCLFRSNPNGAEGKFTLAAVNIAVLLAVRIHVGWWEHKAKIPGVDGYNEAISLTQRMRANLLYLAISWVGVGVLGFVL